MKEERFNELLSRLLDGEPTPEEWDELTALAQEDPALLEEIRSHLETAEWISLAEDELRTPARFLATVQSRLGFENAVGGRFRSVFQPRFAVYRRPVVWAIAASIAKAVEKSTVEVAVTHSAGSPAQSPVAERVVAMSERSRAPGEIVEQRGEQINRGTAKKKQVEQPKQPGAEIDRLVAVLNSTRDPAEWRLAMKQLTSLVTKSNVGEVMAKLGMLDAQNYNEAIAMIYDVATEDWSAGNQMMRSLVEEIMGHSSYEEAMAWVESLPEGAMKGAAAARIIDEWGKQDAIAPLYWAMSLGNEVSRRSALSSAFSKWGAGAGGSDTQVGLDVIGQMPMGSDRDYATHGMACGMAWRHPAEAIALAQTISNEGLRNISVKMVTERANRAKERKE